MLSQLGLMHKSTRNARAQPEEWISTSDAKPHQPDVAHERILTCFTFKIETFDAMTMSLSVVTRRVLRVKRVQARDATTNERSRLHIAMSLRIRAKYEARYTGIRFASHGRVFHQVLKGKLPTRVSKQSDICR